ncbi:MAG: hypothetical protein Q9207_003896 [Kuettlingeria erythrocarpa]
MALDLQPIKTHSGVIFALPANAHRDLPNLGPLKLTRMLAQTNPNLESQLFSKANIISVYRTLRHRHFKELENPELLDQRQKEAMQEFRSWFYLNSHHAYMVLRSHLKNVHEYHIYRHNAGMRLSGKELCSWIIHEINTATPPSIQSGEPIADVSGPVYDGGQEDPEAYHRRTARACRMLLVALPMGAKSDVSDTFSHLHISQTQRVSNTVRSTEMVMGPVDTIALEFSDHATKVLAKLALRNATWRLEGSPWSGFVVQDYPEQQESVEDTPGASIVSMPPRMRLTDFCLRILSLLPHHDYSPCYEFDSSPKDLGTTDYIRLLAQDCPQWLRKLLTDCSWISETVYVTARPTPECTRCTRTGVPFPECSPKLRDQHYEMDFSEGFFPNLIISIDQTLLLNPEDQHRDSEIRIPHCTRPLRVGPPAQDTWTINMDQDAETFYTHHKGWVLENFPDTSTEDKVAEFRRVNCLGLKAMETMVDILAGRFTRWLHGEEKLQANGEQSVAPDE